MKNCKKLIPLFILLLLSCSKDDPAPAPLIIDAKTFFAGEWSGQQQRDDVTYPYLFDLVIYPNNTVKNIDLEFDSQEFPGTYTYTADSLKINYNNGTKWKLRFYDNFTSCSGILLGAQGATGTVTMSKI